MNRRSLLAALGLSPLAALPAAVQPDLLAAVLSAEARTAKLTASVASTDDAIVRAIFRTPHSRISTHALRWHSL